MAGHEPMAHQSLDDLALYADSASNVRVLIARDKRLHPAPDPAQKRRQCDPPLTAGDAPTLQRWLGAQD